MTADTELTYEYGIRTEKPTPKEPAKDKGTDGDTAGGYEEDNEEEVKSKGIPGVYWSTQEYTKVHRSILKYTGVYWNIHAIVYLNTQVYWSMQEYTEVC